MANRRKWNIPGPGIESVSPELPGRFLFLSTHRACLFMVVLLFPSYFMFIAYCKTIVSCISLYFCMIWSGCYAFHVFPHIFGYCDYNFHCIISLDLAFIVRYIFLHCCLKRKYFPMTDTDSPPGWSMSPIPQRWDIKKHFYLSYLPHTLPWLWDL